MRDAAASAVLRGLRRAVGYARLYGIEHPLTAEACTEAARTASGSVAFEAPTLLAIVDGTLFVDGNAAGLTSLQFNGFLEDLTDADIETLTILGDVEGSDIAALVRVMTGERSEYDGGPALRLNDFAVHDAGLRESSTAAIRRSYTRSLDTLRDAGTALAEGAPLNLDATAGAVGEMLSRVIEDPSAALLLSTVKSHHEYTFYHSVNTSILSIGLAHQIGIPERETILLGMGAMLHDIGKVGVSAEVLQHPGRLDDRQWEEVRRHPRIGAEAILAAALPGQQVAAVVALEHHARFDGSGYPRLVYHDGTGHHSGHHPLHYFSRLAAVADTYDALTTRRSYRRAEPASRALAILIGEAGTSYDPDFVLAFAHLMGTHPPGSFLRLTSGHVVMVTGASTPGVTPPAVVVRDAAGGVPDRHEPIEYRLEDVAAHVAPALLGTTPTEVLERMDGRAA